MYVDVKDYINMVEIATKEMKRGREAPAARVKKLEGGDDVIGMLAPEMQVLVSIRTLNTEDTLPVYKKIKEVTSKFKKVKTVFVLSNGGAVCNCLEHVDELGKFQVVYDTSHQFGRKYGAQIIGDDFKDLLTTSVTIVEFEGKIFYREVLEDLTTELNYQELENNIQAIFDEKKKKRGHSHEDWMKA